MKYSIGLDVGTTYVGWSVLNLDKERIEDLGVRVFDAAENPKTGASLALPRRFARGRRKTLRRKVYRVKRTKRMLIENDILTVDKLANLYNPIKGKDIWEARAKGLNELLNNEEWSRLLLFFVKNRGFKSNRKNEINDKEVGPLLKNIKNNIDRIKENKYTTFGEMLYEESLKSNDPSFNFRNKSGVYTNGIVRSEVEKEIKLLFEAQRKFNAEFAKKEIEEKYLEIFNSQRPYSDFETLEGFVGYCTFEKDKKIKRAPKCSISAEEFTMYGNINKLYIEENGQKRSLNEEERNLVVEEAYKKETIKYVDLRKILNLSKNSRFSTLNYSSNNDIVKTESSKFISLKGYHEIRKAISKNINKDYWNEIKKNRNVLNDLAYVLTLAKTDDQITENLKSRNISDELINAVLDISFTKFNNLSIETIEKILPYLKEGYRYYKACGLAGYDIKTIYKGEKTKKLPIMDIEEIVSPVVSRSLSQTRKVINSIINLYGSPETIHIKLARDINKSKLERAKAEKNQKKNEIEKDKLKKELMQVLDKGYEPTGSELLKYRLWKLQKEKCAYTQEKISIDDLFNPGVYEVGYIIPYSRSFDDSFNNKVLVKSNENRRKGRRTPYEYFGDDLEKWNNFEIWVEQSGLPYGKKRNLLKKNFTREDQIATKERNIVDTQYISKYISSFIEERLEFAPSNIKHKVIMLNEQVTSYLKTRWGLYKSYKDNLDYALDASIVATVSQDIIDRIYIYNKAYELRDMSMNEEVFDIETGEILNSKELETIRREKFPMVWPEFKSELMLRLSDNPKLEIASNPIKAYDEEFISNKLRPIFVSRMPKRKIPGKLFEETIYSTKDLVDGKYIAKKKLVDLKADDFNNIYNYSSDKKLYDEIYRIFNENGKDAKKAFGNEPFRKPTKTGKLGPIVNSIKILSNKVPAKDYINFEKTPGNFKRGDMGRIDIYEKDGKFYAVPIYSYQILNNTMPNKAATAGKSEEHWTIIDDSYQFKMSLFKNDLIKIAYKNGVERFGYYIGFDRAGCTFTVVSHDGSEEKRGIGIKQGVTKIEKYNVDVLGYYSKVKSNK